METREARNASNAMATSDTRDCRRRRWRALTTRERERRAGDLRHRRDEERRKRRPSAPEAHAETDMQETQSASNTVVVSSDAREGRRRGWRAPATSERERHTSDLVRRRDDEQCKRIPKAPEAHAEMETRETRTANNAAVATSDASEDRRRLRHMLSWKRERRETQATPSWRRATRGNVDDGRGACR